MPSVKYGWVASDAPSDAPGLENRAVNPCSHHHASEGAAVGCSWRTGRSGVSRVQFILGKDAEGRTAVIPWLYGASPYRPDQRRTK